LRGNELSQALSNIQGLAHDMQPELGREKDESESELEMVVQCCMCKKVRRGTRWLQVVDAGLLAEGVSHGYCPVCAAKAYAELRGLVGPERRPPKTAWLYPSTEGAVGGSLEQGAGAR